MDGVVEVWSSSNVDSSFHGALCATIEPLTFSGYNFKLQLNYI